MSVKKTIFSGVQPSGSLHLGNYLGAINQWPELQDDFRCIFSVVNYHAITVFQDAKVLAEKTVELVKIYLASGINPEKSIIFVQSDVKEHVELAWILNCVSARVSDLKKMTQFKDKSNNNEENISVGLFDYPVLMAADILLYGTDIVPVGEDQVQHVELARTIAKRFNNKYGETFVIPEVKIRKEGARIMGLDNPDKKMSKSSSNPASYIALTDSQDVAYKKIMKAVTDSGSEVKYDRDKKPAISNLLTMYSLLSGLSIKDLEKKYIDIKYGDFKKDLAQVVVGFLASFQKKYDSISDEEVKNILAKGANTARDLAQKMMTEVKKKIGII